jgi:hypothetical protein
MTTPLKPQSIIGFHNPDLMYHMTTDPVVMYLPQQYLPSIVYPFQNQKKQQQKVIATQPEQMIDNRSTTVFAPMSCKQHHQFQ